MDIDHFKTIIQNIFDTNVIEDDEAIMITVARNSREYDFSLSKATLNDLLGKYSSAQLDDELGIVSGNTFETIVSFESSRPYTFYQIRRGMTKHDEQNKLTYTIGPCSHLYLIHLLNRTADIGLGSRDRRSLMDARLRRFLEEYEAEENQGSLSASDSLLSILHEQIYYNVTTLSIENIGSTKPNFNQLVDSFIFSLGYNLNVPIVKVRYAEELTSPTKFIKIRRNIRPDEMDPPRRVFESDLISHYQTGIGSDNPQLQFLSFYHIAEYFFSKVYNEDLVQQVSSEITKPNFSYKRERDIYKLIGVIKERLKVQNEEFSINEQEALRLTIQKYVPDLKKIKEDLSNYDQDLIAYYQSNIVSFSGGQIIDFNLDDSTVIKQISKRMYATRNAIVHSKQSEKPMFIPFKHERELLKEIPLIRFLAEEIIIASSKLL